LSVKALLTKRQNDLIGDHVIDEVCAHGPRITEIAYLYRRRTMGKNIGSTSILSITRQVDYDVHFQLVQKLCDVAVRFQPNIVELIEGFDEAGTHLALVICTKRYTQDLKACPVMQLKQLRYQISDRMLTKVRRQICDTDSLVLIDLIAPQWLWQSRYLV